MGFFSIGVRFDRNAATMQQQLAFLAFFFDGAERAQQLLTADWGRWKVEGWVLMFLTITQRDVTTKTIKRQGGRHRSVYGSTAVGNKVTKTVSEGTTVENTYRFTASKLYTGGATPARLSVRQWSCYEGFIRLTAQREREGQTARSLRAIVNRIYGTCTEDVS